MTYTRQIDNSQHSSGNSTYKKEKKEEKNDKLFRYIKETLCYPSPPPKIPPPPPPHHPPFSTCTPIEEDEVFPYPKKKIIQHCKL